MLVVPAQVSSIGEQEITELMYPLLEPSRNARDGSDPVQHGTCGRRGMLAATEPTCFEPSVIE